MSLADGILSPELAAIVDAERVTNEKITWIGQPIPWRYARMSFPIVLFGIPFTAFAIFWMAGASGFKMPDFRQGFGFFPLFGIPFVLIGLGMLSSPFWMLRKAARTAYVITNLRAILVEGRAWGGFAVRSFDPAHLSDFRRVQFRDGSGNLIFERQYRPGGPNSGGQFIDIGFLAVPNVKEVEDLIRELAKNTSNLA